MYGGFILNHIVTFRGGASPYAAVGYRPLGEAGYWVGGAPPDPLHQSITQPHPKGGYSTAP